MRVRFSCPYPTEVREDDGGCGHEKAWQVDGAEVDGALEVIETDAVCPRCGRVGVADSDRAVLIVAARED